jgi:ribulose kinase
MIFRLNFSMAFTLGIDFGSNSARALILSRANGKKIASGVADYAAGEHGILLDRRDDNLGRQHPGDYLFGFQRSVRSMLERAAKNSVLSAEKVIGIGVDTTGPSPLPVDEKNVPLELLELERECGRPMLPVEGSYQPPRGGANHRSCCEASSHLEVREPEHL